MYHRKGLCNTGKRCVLLDSERENQGDNTNQTRKESISIATTPHCAGGDIHGGSGRRRHAVSSSRKDRKDQVPKVQNIKEKRSKSSGRCSSPPNQIQTLSLAERACWENWTEYRAGEAQMKDKEILQNKKGRIRTLGGSSFVSDDMVTLKKRQLVATFTTVGELVNAPSTVDSLS